MEANENMDPEESSNPPLHEMGTSQFGVVNCSNDGIPIVQEVDSCNMSNAESNVSVFPVRIF